MKVSYWRSARRCVKVELIEDAQQNRFVGKLCFILDLTSGTEDIANLMIKLGPILTHSEVERRRKAVQFVTQIVVLLPSDLLLESQPSHILTFFHARLQDHHSLIPHLLPGINSLCMMKNAVEEDVLRVLFTILSGTVIMCQSQQREERSRIFDLIIYCSTTYYDTLVKRSSDYIQGVINAIEGERDPRNLLKLFEFMPSFLEKYPLEQWADEMFEVFACYYPIDFHPSPNDPNAITRDALAGKLERCLLGCKDFIEPALVLALEKLDTQLKVAKLDSLALLRSCAQKYGCNEIEAKFDNIWMTVKQELLPGLNDDVVRASLDTTRVIVQESREDQIRENILTVAFNSIAISLCDINLRMFYPAVRVASALGSASPESAQFIADKVAPIFLRQLEECGDLDENKEKKNILLGLLKDSISIASEKKCLNKLNQDVLTEIEKVFVSCLSDATHERIRTVGYLGLVEMCSQTNPETRQLIYTSFLEALRKGTSSELPIHTCCTRLIEYFPEEVITEFVTPLTKDQSVVSDLNCEEIFRILCTFIGPCRVNNEDVYKYLLNFVFQEQGIHLNDAEKQSRILLKLLTTLNELLKSGNPHVAKNFHNEHRLIDRLLESRAMFKGHVILQPLSTLLVNVISVQTDDEQKKLVEKYLPLLKVSEATDLYFIYGLLCRCSNAVPLEGIYEILVPDLIRASLAGGNNEQLQICDYLLCVLFNRNYQSVESWEQVLEGSIGQIKRSITESGQALRTLAWITKGLLMRGHPTADELVLIVRIT